MLDIIIFSDMFNQAQPTGMFNPSNNSGIFGTANTVGASTGFGANLGLNRQGGGLGGGGNMFSSSLTPSMTAPASTFSSNPQLTFHFMN